MMTIDEAIIHAEKKGQELGCTECAQEHYQLAGWLRELKFRRKQQLKSDAIRWRVIMRRAKNQIQSISRGVQMMSNIKKYVRKFSTVTVTSKCGCKTFRRLNRGGVHHWINGLPNGKPDESSSEMTEQEGVYHWINVFPNGKLDDSSVEITEQDFVALLEIFSKAGMRVKFSL